MNAIHHEAAVSSVSLLSFAGFNPMQLVGMLHGYFQRDRTIVLGMLASLRRWKRHAAGPALSLPDRARCR